MKRFLHSVRLRLTLWYGGILALVLLVFALSVYIFVVRSLQTNIDSALKSYGQQLNQTVVRQSHGRAVDVKRVTVPKVSRAEPIVAVLIMDLHGRLKAVKHGHASPNYQQLRIDLRRGTENCGTFSASGGIAMRAGPLRYCVKLAYKKGKPIGGVEVVESLAGVDKALERLRLALLLGIPLALVLAGAGGWILAGRALEPVNRITKMARSITATDLSRRIALDRQDELGHLAGTFDDMIDRLERAFQEQRQLTADVSHELRSPLTILEAQTTLALRRSRSPEEYRQALASVQDEVERMSRMVNELLTLARADAGEEPLDIQLLRLAAVAEPVIEQMRPLAMEVGIALGMQADPDVWVQGDATRMRQLLINLLDNALRHTNTGGRVDIAVGRSGRQVYLKVSDTGTGIPPEDLPHVFQRFYRGDRARRRGEGNSGLGLAIAKWIVQAHGGDIQVQSMHGEGTTFSASFPEAVFAGRDALQEAT